MKQLVVAVVLAMALSACTLAPDEEMVEPTTTETVTRAPRKPDVPTLLFGTAGIDVNDVAWAQASTIHIGERSADVAPLLVEDFVVAPGGVYFLAKGELWFTDLLMVKPTGIARVEGLTISVDGNYVGLIDYEHGKLDRYDTPLAAAVAYDTRTGKRVVRSSAGMGSTKQDDLADLYEDATPLVLGFSATDFYVQTAGDAYAVPLDGGKARKVTSAPVSSRTGVEIGADRAPDGTIKVNRVIGMEPYSATLGPGEKYGVVGGSNFEFYPFLAATGKPVEVGVGHPRFIFGAWTGPSTFYGKAMDDAEGEAGGYLERGIWACDLAVPTCDEVVAADEIDPEVEVLFGSGAGPAG